MTIFPPRIPHLMSACARREVSSSPSVFLSAVDHVVGPYFIACLINKFMDPFLSIPSTTNKDQA